MRKDKIKKVWSHIYSIFLLFVFFTSATWSIAILFVLPRFGLGVLLISVGWYGLYSYFKHKEE